MLRFDNGPYNSSNTLDDIKREFVYEPTTKTGHVYTAGVAHRSVRAPKPSRRSSGRAVRRFLLRFLKQRGDQNGGYKGQFNPQSLRLLRYPLQVIEHFPQDFAAMICFIRAIFKVRSSFVSPYYSTKNRNTRRDSLSHNSPDWAIPMPFVSAMVERFRLPALYAAAETL